MASSRALKQEFDDVKKHNESLKATIARYQKELKERERAFVTPQAPTGALPGASAFSSQPKPKGPDVKAPESKGPDAKFSEGKGMGEMKGGGEALAPLNEPTKPVPPQMGQSPVNVNTAPAVDLVLLLGLSKEQADKIIANRPYRVKGELVAKNVLPKMVFDGVKDKITVAQ